MNYKPLFLDVRGVGDMRSQEIAEVARSMAMVLGDVVNQARAEMLLERRRVLIEGVASKLAVQVVDMSIACFQRGAAAALEAANQTIKENRNAQRSSSPM